MTMVLIMFGVLVVLLVIGTPISVSLGCAATLAFYLMDVRFNGIPQRMFAATDNSSLLAIPFFVLAGNLMASGGIASRISDLMNAVIGRMRGGMALAVIASCAFFAALSGSGPATAIAIGATLYPSMIKQGYNKGRAAGLIAVSGGLGPIIPPSITMVVYANTVNASVPQMFKAGTVCGLLITGILMFTVVFYANKEQWPKNEIEIPFGELLRKFFVAIPALMMPLIILGGIFSGKFTPTEAANIAVVASLIVSLFIYKEIKFGDIGSILYDSALGTAVVMFIIGTSSVFSYIFTYSAFSKLIANFIVSLNLAPLLFVSLVGLIILVFGFFMDGLPIVLLLMPILWPIALTMGINPVYFGMMVTIGIVMGTMTPPVAVNLFAVASVTKLPIEVIAKGELPFFFAMLFALLLIVLFPEISLLLL